MTHIHDPLYGTIAISPIMKLFIDTPEFQRLRFLKQLGVCYLVFPSATHTRFEHSLGVSHLTFILLTHLKTHHPDLEISDKVIELIQLAGLLHDIGHGPLSHMYDAHFSATTHEKRGIEIINRIVKTHNIPLSESDCRFIADCIDPQPNASWQYQIVANKQSHVDTDKLDYLRRDCYHLGLDYAGEYSRILTNCRIVNNNIAFADKIKYDILSIFLTRYRLHKQVYCHHAVIGFQLSIISASSTLELRDDLTDSVFDSIIINLRRTQHRVIFEKTYTTHFNEDCLNLLGIPDEIICVQTRLSLASDSTSTPIEAILFYSHPNYDQSFTLKLSDISVMFSNNFYEVCVRLYRKHTY